MNSQKIVTHAGLTLNLADVKCFRLSSYEGIGKRNTIIVEFKTRYNYIHNPQINQWEKQEYNETTEIEFPHHETAQAYVKDWLEIWQDYLDDQTLIKS